MARVGLSRAAGEDLVAIRLDDFVKRGQSVVLNHLRALQAYQPAWHGRSVPTIVVWGENDRSIPLADHVELAMKLGGVLVPLADVGHAAFLEDPASSVGAIRLIERLLRAWPTSRSSLVGEFKSTAATSHWVGPPAWCLPLMDLARSGVEGQGDADPFGVGQPGKAPGASPGAAAGRCPRWSRVQA